MEIEKVVLFILILFTIVASEQHGFAKFDNGLAIINYSPHSQLALLDTIPTTTMEISLNNKFSAIFSDDERLYNGSWGVLWGKNRSRFSSELYYNNGFSLIERLDVKFNYATFITPKFSVGGAISAKRIWIEYDSDYEFGGELSVAFIKNGFASLLSYRYTHLSTNLERSIPLGKVIGNIRLTDNVMGSQGISLSWNHSDKKGDLYLIEAYPIIKWLILSISLTTSPFILSLGSTFKTKSVVLGIHFSRTPYLGWSQQAVLSFMFK